MPDSSPNTLMRIERLLTDNNNDQERRFTVLENSVVKLTDAVTQLTSTTIRNEQLHLAHTDSLKRAFKKIEDHEARLRNLELGKADNSDVDEIRREIVKYDELKSTWVGGWRAITIVAVIVSTLMGLSFAAVNAFT